MVIAQWGVRKSVFFVFHLNVQFICWIIDQSVCNSGSNLSDINTGIFQIHPVRSDILILLRTPVTFSVNLDVKSARSDYAFHSKSAMKNIKQREWCVQFGASICSAYSSNIIIIGGIKLDLFCYTYNMNAKNFYWQTNTSTTLLTRKLHLLNKHRIQYQHTP